jgi:hypothetical protein
MFSLLADSCCCCFSFSSDSLKPVTPFELRSVYFPSKARTYASYCFHLRINSSRVITLKSVSLRRNFLGRGSLLVILSLRSCLSGVASVTCPRLGPAETGKTRGAGRRLCHIGASTCSGAAAPLWRTGLSRLGGGLARSMSHLEKKQAWKATVS